MSVEVDQALFLFADCDHRNNNVAKSRYFEFCRDIGDHRPSRTKNFELLKSQTQSHNCATDRLKSTTERIHSWDTQEVSLFLNNITDE